MIIYIMTNTKKLITFNLSIIIKGNYWISYNDKNNDKVNLLNVHEKDGQWQIQPNEGYELYDNGTIVRDCFIKDNSFYFLKSLVDGGIITIFCSSIETEQQFYNIQGYSEILIGNDSACNIYYRNSLVSSYQAKITTDNGIKISNLNQEKTDIYVNKNLVVDEDTLFHFGDVIFIMGLKIIIIGNILIVNNPANSVEVNLPLFDKTLLLDKDTTKIEDDDANVLVYSKKDYFSRSPQFRSTISTLNIRIDDPPQKEKEDDTPTLLVVGPMLTMGMTSVVMLYSAVNNAVTNGKGINSALPQIIMSLAMLATMLLWPLLTKKYRQKKYYQNESKRKTKYEEYIQFLYQEISKAMTSQRQILMENHISIEECVQIILNRSTRLWGRKIQDNDFLVVRLGLGTVPLDIKLDYSPEKFSLEDDVLRDIVKNLVSESHNISGAPVTMSLYDKRISGVVGNYQLSVEFLKGILIQLLTFYSADLLKLVILTNNENEHNWNWLKELQHCWDNEQITRFYADNNDDAKEVFKYLEKVFDYRKDYYNDNQVTRFTPYFLILCDDYKMISENNFIKKLLTSNFNLGFSIVIISEMISTLPNECSCFINVNRDISGLIENELTTSNQKEFVTELVNDEDIIKCSQVIANIPIMIDTGSKGLPDSIGLLEMYNVGKVEGLNSFDRWKQNDPTISLTTPIGIDVNGDLFKLDLHEKFHGPHGLIAGMTGSGKSEFIITMVLSMAINYHPNEVAFVLIDYKGGGLALAFENKDMGIKLPHIAGTITNLDVTELNRALTSIEAELRRRQKEFNNARDISGESTIDIYKYQKLYREGVVTKPIPHLFLICDEFAELKAQQPEFMDQLISTARIGRSLGVHLILATQKPSGVVNDQIWSNAKFKICLKVQDKADSKDMIQVPDAAEIKQVGRFYMLVGYNDYFALGQSAYCGMPYIPSDVIRKNVDTSLNFINNVGYVIKSIDDIKTKEIQVQAQGEVLSNVVKYLAQIAKEENIVVNRLWLDRIPNIIYVQNLHQKYNYQKEDFIINPIIGEYDDPSTQYQGLVTLPLSKVGNTIIYGMIGSGKESLLSTIIYSSIITYTTEELNFYIIDCGAETLKIFSKAPQVGDVMFNSETEKINNCFSMLNELLANRKKTLAEYSGDINIYNSVTEKKLPFLIIVINGYENFNENYNDLEETIIKLTREGAKCGIIFMATCTSSSSIRTKVRQNFSYSICLRLNDPYEYTTIFGTRSKILPSENSGRGLIKIDNIYEFQSASICSDEQKNKYINDLCKKINASLPLKAPRVPILPDKVDWTYFEDIEKRLDAVPIAIEKQSLKTNYYNFKANPINLVLGNTIKNVINFATGLIQILSKINNSTNIVIDGSNLGKNKVLNVNYYANNYEEIVKKCIEVIDNSLTVSSSENDLVITIISINNILETLDSDLKRDFTESIAKIKKIPFIRVILIDTPDSLKLTFYEPWLKSNVDQAYGIWVGKGITDQSILKTGGANYRDIAIMLNNDMGYVINDEIPVLAKLIEYSDEQKNEIEVL